jgi:hypothetical protein
MTNFKFDSDKMEELANAGTILSRDIESLIRKIPVNKSSCVGWALFMLKIGIQLDFVGRALVTITEEMNKETNRGRSNL